MRIPMDYEITLKLALASPDNAEQITKRLRAVLEFGTIREVIGDALDLENDYHLAGVDVTHASHADTR